MTTSESPAPRLHLRVTPTAEWKLRSGHPWLYAESILAQNRAGRLGELAVIYDRYDNFLAIGLFDPTSPIRVRVLVVGKPRPIDSKWWRMRFNEAAARRDGLFDERTTGYRLIHGESDGWPGLVLDRYDATLVLKLYTAAWFPWLEEIADCLPHKVERVVLRLSRNVRSVADSQFSLSDGQILRGKPLDEPVMFLESGLRFEADVVRGQKTGFFLDQRENRRWVETMAEGRSVLNVFSFSGGFSLYAARGGAHAVTDLDISTHALESARRNLALNQTDAKVAACRHETIQADAFEWLKSPTAAEFDFVILDPPSLARKESERSRALHAYGNLALSALRNLRAGGILVAASCSAHVSPDEFFQTIRSSCENSGRRFDELQTTGHPPDHPANFPEARYLKCICLRF